MATVIETAIPAPHVEGTHSRTLAEMVARMTGREGTAIRYPRDGAWHEISFPGVARAASEIAGGLIALGIEPGDKVSILSSTRPEWTLADFGAIAAATSVVPVYHTNSPEECAYVLGHSEARAVVCENAEQLAKIDAVRAELPHLEHVIAIEDATPGVVSLDDLRRLGAELGHDAVERRLAVVRPDDLATIVYTSGTTGPPKGCMVTHANWATTVAAYEERLGFLLGEPPTIFMFLPLAHSLARIIQLVTLDLGGTLAFWSGDTKAVLEEIVEARPTHLPSVPRVFEKIHTKALASAEEGGGLKKAVFSWAVATGGRARAAARAGRSPNPLLRVQAELADRLVLSKVRALFGPDLDMALTGAAPIAPEILEFFDACGILVLEGYGMTETCAAGTINTPDELRFGSVGRTLPGTELTIAPDGEILMRGPHIFQGYYKNEEATGETIDADGWLHSGDLGAIDADGFVHITGRKKELIVTSSGKNISPNNIEMALRETRWISQAVVYGDRRSYLVALITLDPESLAEIAEHCGAEPADAGVLATDPRVREEIQAAVDAVNAKLARIEQVKRFAILDHDLSQERGELTPTLKIKRNVVYAAYRGEIEALYE